ncbi:MAG: glycosyltransferase family 2 protein [Kiritimatiellia bacterium]
MATELSRVSVLVVTYRGDDLLAACLDSLAAVDPDGELEIVVVDNSPAESTRRLVVGGSGAASRRYVASPVCRNGPFGNSGFAGGNNLGWRHCTRPHVLLMNNDTKIFSADSIAILSRFLDANPACGAVQGKLILPNTGNLLGGAGGALSPFGFQFAYGFMTPDGPAFDRAYPAFSVFGAFMMVRAEAVRAAGGFLFRTHFWSYYEETDLCHRLWLAGYEVWYAPTPPIAHYLGRTSSKFPRAAVMKRYLGNQYYSLSVCCGPVLRLYLLPAFCLVLVAWGTLQMLRGRFALGLAGWSAVLTGFRRRKRILAGRRQIARFRRRSDWRLMPKIMRLPSPLSMLRQASGG